MKYLLLLMSICLALFSCTHQKTEELNAQFIVDKAIEASGKAKLNNAKLSFEFRNKTYQSIGNCSGFTFRRIDTKASYKIVNEFETGQNLKQYINDSLNTIADSTAFKISEAINSVHYFVQLPARLNDEAVEKSYLGIDSIKNKAYHRIKVTFKKEGGGTDYQDVYHYWFNKENYKLDYLAYSFTVNGGGIRFREAYNERYVEGIRFVDYKNYKPKSDQITLKNISKAFENNDLKLLSKIENYNLKVEIMDKKC